MFETFAHLHIRHFHIFHLYIFILFFSISTYAQTFGGGAIAGFTGSQIDGDRFGGYHKLGLQLGVFTTRTINKKFTAQIEIKYNQKGATKITNSNEMDLYDVRLQYAELALLCRYKVYKKLEAELGFAPAILLKAKQNIDGDLFIANPFKKYDIPFILGAYYFFKPKLALNIRFSNSLVTIRTNTYTDKYFHYYGQYNKQLCFGIYYYIK